MASVLVVDDTLDCLVPLTRLLRLEGFDTTAAQDGRQALEMMERSRPDVLVLDLMMPGIDGVTLLEEIRGTPGLEQLPVVVFTALEDRTVRNRVDELGVAAVLYKGRAGMDEIIRSVHDCMTRH
jgi:CheY-like chemotaxis protein